MITSAPRLQEEGSESRGDQQPCTGYAGGEDGGVETRPLQREPHLQGGSRHAGEAGELGAASGQRPEPGLMPLGPFWRAEGGEAIPGCLTWRLKGGRAQCVQGLSSASRQPSLWFGRGIGAVPPGPFLGTAALTPQHALFSACLQELWVQRGAQLRLYLATPPSPCFLSRSFPDGFWLARLSGLVATWLAVPGTQCWW